VQQELENFFERYASKTSVFRDKKPFSSSFMPNTIPHRESQINDIAAIIAPTLKLEKHSNLFIYGKTGTGKSLSVKATTDHLQVVARKKNIPLQVIRVNCKMKRVSDTEYRLIAQLARELGKTLPSTGLPTDEIYKTFVQAVDETRQSVLLVLDEIDQLAKKTGSEVLYNLTRMSEDLTNAQISLIGISNDLLFVDSLDPRVKSSLSEEEIIFPPYNAVQLQDILTERAAAGFVVGALEAGVVQKCAAYAAREHGDARRALELLRVAGEIADRTGKNIVGIKHVDQAEEKIDSDRVLDAIAVQPNQSQATLLAILSINSSKQGPLFTGEVYEYYKTICDQAGFRPLTQRRVSDIIGELDMLGIITARVVSKGRYGRTREIVVPSTAMNPSIKNILVESLNM
jgi:archaeal cell division control protein 6